MNLTVTCGCGGRASVAYASLEQGWHCADCGQDWRADPQSLTRFADLAAVVRRTRVVVLLSIVVGVVAAVVLAVLHPSWVLLVPLAFGVGAFLYRPRYKRVYKELPQAALQKVHRA